MSVRTYQLAVGAVREWERALEDAKKELREASDKVQMAKEVYSKARHQLELARAAFEATFTEEK